MAATIARVFVNNIEVGALPAEHYHQVVSQLRRDKRLRVAQALSYVGQTFRYMGRKIGLFAVVLAACWVLMLLAMAMLPSAALAQEIGSVAQATPTVLADQIHRVNGIFMAFAFLVAALSMMFTLEEMVTLRSDPIGRAINRQLRMLLEVPTEGPVTVAEVAPEASALEAAGAVRASYPHGR